MQMTSSPYCSICATTFEKNSDFNFIESSGQFNPLESFELCRSLFFAALRNIFAKDANQS
jgi:ribosomal protein S16